MGKVETVQVVVDLDVSDDPDEDDIERVVCRLVTEFLHRSDVSVTRATVNGQMIGPPF